MHLDPDLHPDERDTKTTHKQTDGRTNIENGDPSTQKAPKGATTNTSFEGKVESNPFGRFKVRLSTGSATTLHEL